MPQPLRLICPGSVGMVGQCLRKGRLQMGVARQTDRQQLDLKG